MNALRALWHALWTDPAPEMRLAPAVTIAGPRCPCGAPGTVPVRAGFDNYTVCEQHAPRVCEWRSASDRPDHVPATV